MSIKLVSVDFDNTLTRRVSAIEHYASKTGRLEYIRTIERQFFNEEIGTREFSDLTAMCFAGVTQEAIHDLMHDLPLIDGTSMFFRTLFSNGIGCVINSVAFQPLIMSAARRWSIDRVSGVKLSASTGRYTGHIDQYFSENEKIKFVQDCACQYGIALEEVAAIGDSRSDVPLFKAVGMSVALNGDHRAIAAAGISIETNDICDLLPLILDDI